MSADTSTARKAAILVSAVFLVIAASYWVYGDSNDAGIRLDEFIASTVSERITRDVTASEFDTLITFDSNIPRPELLRFFDHELYIADLGLMRVARFSLHGDLRALIGESTGAAPGDIRFITDLYVRNDTLWLTDTRAKAVHMFTTKGEYLNRFFTPYHDLRLTGFQSGIALLGLGTPALFHYVSPEGNELKTFGELVDDQTRNSLALNGVFLRHNRISGFKFIPKLASFIYSYDETGSLVSIQQTIDKTDFIAVPSVRQGGGNRRFAPHQKYMVADASADSQTIFLHVRVNDESESASILDYYNYDLEYLRSLNLPSQVKNAQVYNQRLYLLTDTNVLVSSFKVR